MAAQQAAKDGLAYSDFLEDLLREEMAGPTVRKPSTMMRLADFPTIKTLQQFNYDFAKGVKGSQVEELAALGFIDRNKNVALHGSSRVGKTHLAMTLGYRPTQAGSKTYFINASHLYKSQWSSTLIPTRIISPKQRISFQ